MPKYSFQGLRDNLEGKRQTIVLTITKACNLRCSYCYESKSRGAESIDFETARDIIKYYMEADNGFEAIEFDFFGGEPLLKFSLIKEIIEWFKSVRTWRKRFIFLIETNGTLLTDEIKNWLNKNKYFVIVTFSIDGNQTAHNLTRDNSYDLLLPNIPFFQENWPFQPAKMTICEKNLPFLAESVIELEKMGLFFTANIVFEDIWGVGEKKKEMLKEYEKQLDQLVEFYSERLDLYPVGPILSHVIEAYDKHPIRDENGCLRFCGAGHEMIMVDVDGTIYPCHRFAPWVTGRPAPRAIVNNQIEWRPEECKLCKLISICPTCAGFNWQINGDTGIRTRFHCDAFKVEFIASAKLEANRIANMDDLNLRNLSAEELQKKKSRIEVIYKLINEGLI